MKLRLLLVLCALAVFASGCETTKSCDGPGKSVTVGGSTEVRAGHYSK